jgi:hypothetical protein
VKICSVKVTLAAARLAAGSLALSRELQERRATRG